VRAARMRIGVAFGIALFVAACGSRPPEQDPKLASDDALFVTLKERFGVAPCAVAIRLEERVDITFDRYPWSSASEEAQYDRAYDVARVAWDSYGASHGIDTVTIRTTNIIRRDSIERREYQFLPAQLTSMQRPTMSAAPRGH